MSETVSDTIPRLGSLPTAADQAQAGRDRSLTSAAAVELARGALAEVVAADCVGDHVAAAYEAERLVTHLFDCSLPGYQGWRWAVTLSRLPRSRTASVCEMELLPGEEALLAPAWVPWADRLRPEDLMRAERSAQHRGSGSGDADGLVGAAGPAGGWTVGRVPPRPPRVLAATGVARAVSRWYDGWRAQHEAGAPGAAAAVCSSRGLSLPMTGALRAVLGDAAGRWDAGSGQEPPVGSPSQDGAAPPGAGGTAQPVDEGAAPAGGGGAEESAEESTAVDDGAERRTGPHGSHSQAVPLAQARAASARAAVVDLEARLSARSTSAGAAAAPEASEVPERPGAQKGPQEAGSGDGANGAAAGDESGGAGGLAGQDGADGAEDPKDPGEPSGLPRTLEELEAVLPRR